MGKTLDTGHLHTQFHLGKDKTNISSQDQQESNQQKPVKTILLAFQIES